MSNTSVQCGYFDGLSAMEQPVAVEFLVQGLVFKVPSGALVSWGYDELRLISLQRDNGHMTLGWAGDSAVRMRIKNAEAGIQLFKLAPHLKAERPERGVKKPAMVSVAIIAVLAGLYFAYPVARQGLMMSMPDSWVSEIGMAMGQGVFGAAPTCSEAKGVAALEKMTARLTKGQTMPYELDVRVVDLPMVNAFAVPGGRVVLSRGLLDKADSPEEIAGVLGHELGHVKHRHPLKRMIDVYGFELLLSGLGGNFGAYGGMVLLMKYSRDDEREADQASLDLLDNADISSEGFADFFERLQEGGAYLPDIVQFLSTHPLPDERAETIRESDTEDDVTTPALTAKEWQALKNICGEKAVDPAQNKRKHDPDEEIIQI